ncbi:oxidoreductase-like protein [Podospora fimiseda]|uniref:Oxidoreductase-like protein n=1 Tax=Podospora fimiseda TaxID=252190 RepID=A0AAN7BLY3_9PEZI|nr:oxidoreductase-like protein [Podospora fimiseda]
MRRTILSAQPARAVSRAFGNVHPRRSFAIASSGTEQVFPVGAFYEAVVRTPSGAVPKVKPEEPPVTSRESSKPAPKATATPEEVKPEAKDDKPKPTAQDVPKVEEKPATPAEKPSEKPTEKKPSKPASPPKNPTNAASSSSEAPKDKPAPPRKEFKPRKPRTNGTKEKSVYSSPSSSEIDDDVPPSSDPPPPPPISSSTESNTPDSSQAEQRARVIFGSSLAGPAERAERLARIKNQSRLIAGVLVPPKPDEPDNCCMSGCVNCVWDRYRDEMEEWVFKSKEAEARLAAREAGAEVAATEESVQQQKQKINLGVHELDGRGAVSIDDDGGGSSSNWTREETIAKNLWDDDLYKNVPVGIREFMKQEKRLKEKHSREGTLGG